jgi:hypothetical protein
MASGCQTGGVEKCWRKPSGASLCKGTRGKCASHPKTSADSGEKRGIWVKETKKVMGGSEKNRRSVNWGGLFQADLEVGLT